MIQSVIDFSRSARDEGIRRAVDHAEEDAPGWADRAYGFLSTYAQSHERFQVWMVAQEFRRVVRIDNEKAWGGIVRRALKDGIVQKDGWAPNPRRHATDAPVYRSLVYREAA